MSDLSLTIQPIGYGNYKVTLYLLNGKRVEMSSKLYNERQLRLAASTNANGVGPYKFTYAPDMNALRLFCFHQGLDGGILRQSSFMGYVLPEEFGKAVREVLQSG